jgi:hypothetical protein
MLFKTIDQFREHIPVNTGLAFKSLERDIQRVEKKYLVPYLGQAMYDELNEAFEGGNPSEELQALLFYAREVVAPFALSQALPIIQVQISDSGVQSVDTKSEKNSDQWKVDALNEEYCLKIGWENLEEMMKILEANADDYETWADDETASTIHKQYIINTTREFNSYYFIGDSPLTFKALEPSMKNAQLLDFAGGPGEEMMTRILEEIKSGEISDDIEELMKWLKPMFTNLVIHRGIKQLYITIRPDGIYTNSYKADFRSNNRERNAATSLQMQYVDETWNQACIYRAEMMKYLQANASEEKYPEFFNSDLYVPPVEDVETTVCCCGTCATCLTKKRKFYRF